MIPYLNLRSRLVSTSKKKKSAIHVIVTWITIFSVSSVDIKHVKDAVSKQDLSFNPPLEHRSKGKFVERVMESSCLSLCILYTAMKCKLWKALLNYVLLNSNRIQMSLKKCKRTLKKWVFSLNRKKTDILGCKRIVKTIL